MRIISLLALLSLLPSVAAAQRIAEGSRVFVVGAGLLEVAPPEASGEFTLARYRLFQLQESDIVGQVVVRCPRAGAEPTRTRFYLDEDGDTIRTSPPTGSTRARVADWLEDTELVDRTACAEPLGDELSRLLLPDSLVRQQRTVRALVAELGRQQFEHKLLTDAQSLEVILCAGFLIETGTLTAESPKIQLVLRMIVGVAGNEPGSPLARALEAVQSEEAVAQAIVDFLGLSSVEELESEVDESALNAMMSTRCMTHLQDVPKSVSSRLRGASAAPAAPARSPSSARQH